MVTNCKYFSRLCNPLGCHPHNMQIIILPHLLPLHRLGQQRLQFGIPSGEERELAAGTRINKATKYRRLLE